MIHSTSAIRLLVAPESGAILDASQGACEFYGFPREALLTKTVAALTDSSSKEVPWKLGTTPTGKLQALSSRHKNRSGRTTEVLVVASSAQLAARSVWLLCIHPASPAAQEQRSDPNVQTMPQRIPAQKGNSFEAGSAIADELIDPLSAIVSYAAGCIQRLWTGPMESEELIEIMENIATQAEKAGRILHRIRHLRQ